MPTEKHLHQGARLLYFSFANEFDRILCDGPLWMALLKECNYSRAIYLTQNDDLLGICGCYFDQVGFFPFDEALLHRYCPQAPWQILQRLQSICTDAQNETFYIEALAIHPAHRRKGLAKHVLRCAQNQARARGYRRLALDVDCRNSAAYNLYLSEGFVVDGNISPQLTNHSHQLRLIKFL